MSRWAVTLTGRFAEGPEMQDHRRRPAVDSPLVNVDFSQIEARILAQKE